jgi:flagellar biosynthesis protein FlhG
MARVIVFTSAAKQVGKTSLCVNLAIYLGQLGHATCLFNADADAATVYNLLDIHPRHFLRDLIENRVRMEHAVIKDIQGIDFFPGCPGIDQISALDQGTRNRLHRSFMYFNRYDFFVVDTFSGISRNVVALCKASLEVVLVMTADARSLTNAYFLLKTLSVNKFDGSVMVLINMSRDLKLARRSYNRFKEAVTRYLPVAAVPLGTVFFDPQVGAAEKARLPFTSLYPDSDASRCVANIAQHLSGKKNDDMAVSAFWSRFVDNLKHPFQIVGNPQQVFRQKPMPASGEKDDIAGVGETGQTLSEPGEENRSGTEALDVLARLEAQMSDLSKEVTDIKQTIDTLSESRQTVLEPETKAEPLPQQKKEKLVLDFETFLTQRERGGI